MLKYLFLIFALLTIGYNCQLAVLNELAPVTNILNFVPSVTNTVSDLTQRLTQAVSITEGVVSGALIKSLELVKDVEQTALDGIRAVLYAINPTLLSLGGVAPTASLAYYPNQASVTSTAMDKNGYNFDISQALNFVQLKFSTLEEVDPSGNVVSSINLNALNWVVVSTNITAKLNPLSLPTITLGASVQGIHLQVSLVASANLGTLDISNLLNTLLSPQGIQLLFSADLSGYNYLNSGNLLRLVINTVSGANQVLQNVESTLGGLTTTVTSTLNGVLSTINLNQAVGILGGTTDILNIVPTLLNDLPLGGILNDILSLTQLNQLLGSGAQGTGILVPFSVGLKARVVVGVSLSIGVDPNINVSTSKRSLGRSSVRV